MQITRKSLKSLVLEGYREGKAHKEEVPRKLQCLEPFEADKLEILELRSSHPDFYKVVNARNLKTVCIHTSSSNTVVDFKEFLSKSRETLEDLEIIYSLKEGNGDYSFLKGLKVLRRFNLRNRIYCHDSFEPLPKVLSHLVTNVTRMTFKDFDCQESDLRIIRNNFKNLTDLELSFSEKSSGFNILWEIEGLTRLRIRDKLEGLETLPIKGSITSLSLEDIKITEDTFKIFLEKCPNVETFHLSSKYDIRYSMFGEVQQSPLYEMSVAWKKLKSLTLSNIILSGSTEQLIEFKLLQKLHMETCSHLDTLFMRLRAANLKDLNIRNGIYVPEESLQVFLKNSPKVERFTWKYCWRNNDDCLVSLNIVDYLPNVVRIQIDVNKLENVVEFIKKLKPKVFEMKVIDERSLEDEYPAEFDSIIQEICGLWSPRLTISMYIL